jgi:hypothetical protein
MLRRMAPLVTLLASCGQAPVESTGSRAGSDASLPTPGGLDDGAIEALAADYKGLTRVSTSAFPSRGHQGNPLVNVFVSSAVAPLYSTLDSTGTAPPGFAFPVGSLLVKEMLDPSGAPPILTAMYKKAPGYDPSHHDWWYGRLDASGAPTDPAYVGNVSFCIACHAGATGSDFAWGVPAANK